MSRDTRSRNRKLLVAGTAGLLMAAPLAPALTWDLNAAEPAARQPQSMLQRIVDREARTLATDASGTGGGDIVTVAGNQPAVVPAQQGTAEFQQQYGSEVQRQLQKLYQQDGRTMPQMMVPQMPSPSTYQRPAAPRKRRLTDVFSPSAWRARFSRSQEQEQPPAAPEFNPADDTLGQPGTMPQPFAPPPAPAVAEQPAPRPELQRYSPEIFAGDDQLPTAAPPAVAADASQQPGLFPGVAQAPAALPETTTSSSASPTPLLIILPEDPATAALAEPTPAPSASVPAGSVPDSLAAPDTHLAGELPRLETALSAPSEATAAPSGLPSLELADPDSTALANPFPEMPEEAADAAAGPYTGLELEESPYQPAGDLAVPADAGAFAAPAPQAEPTGPQLAGDSRLRPAAENGPVLIAPGGAAPSELPLVQPGRPIEASAPQLTAAPQQAAAPRAAAGTHTSAAEKMARIAERKGLTGFKGFCPVMLRDYRELVDASEEFSVIYQGQQYWFSSADARQAFVANPGAYLPAGGGVDPVVYHQSGQSVAGSLDNAVWYHGQLYLFSSEVTKAEFVAAPRAHAFE